MKSFGLRVGLTALLMVGFFVFGNQPAASNDAFDEPARPPQKRRALRGGLDPLAYRSPGALRKLVVRRGDALEDRFAKAGRRVRRYASYSVIEVSEAELAQLDAARLAGARLRDDFNLLFLRRGQLDTRGASPQIAEALRQPETRGAALHLVQLFGPPAPEDLRAIEATGARIISYVPNNGYLVWASAPARRRLKSMADRVQWEGAFHPYFKLDPSIDINSEAQIRATITLIDAPESRPALAAIRAQSRQVLMEESALAGTVTIRVLIEANRLADVARLAPVVAIEPWGEIRLKDERANQIIAGALHDETVNNVKVSRPNGPGFLAFLDSLGLNSRFDFAVDVADTGLDIGAWDNRIHPDFLDAAGNSRVAYLHDWTNDLPRHQFNPAILPSHDSSGHGTLNASIIGGFNVQTGPAFQDALGFQYGQGVAPFVRIGVTKIFNDDFAFGTTSPFSDIVRGAYRFGARVSNNSWGLCSLLTGFCNLYNADARDYDALVRDADNQAPGNQQMVIVFSSGNEGLDAPQTVNMPGTAKNVITVGASEGFRATGDDGKPLRDGCGVGPTIADNANDVALFSSGGFVQDGRAKPDIVAPGTHITGAATQDGFFPQIPLDFIGTCDHFFPAGQTRYTWSSGTSHAAPLVSGAAALARQWLRNRQGTEPSAALVKALLLNSTTYLTGRLANDNLPGPYQGWGLLNIARAFEDTARIIYDESPERTFTVSGGEPFKITGVIDDPTKEFRVMLVYTDAPGSALSNAPYINQLNLEVVVGGVVYHGNQFEGPYSKPGGDPDVLNNAQGVRLPAGTVGPFLIRVRPAIIAGDGVPGNGEALDQDFALVVTNGREEPAPALTLDEEDGVTAGVIVTHESGAASDAAVLPGETANIQIRLRNESRTAAAQILSAELAVPDAGGVEAAYPEIEAGGEAVNGEPFRLSIPSSFKCGSVAELQLRVTTQAGLFTLPVRVRVGRVVPGSEDTVLVFDDVDTQRVKWKLKKGFRISNSVGNSGTSSYHAVDPGREIDDEQLSLMKLKKAVLIPANAGRVRLRFYHIFNFEPGFDGGVVEISTDGKTWQDLGSRIMVGKYDGHVTEASFNPLGNRMAWTSRGRAGVFSPVVINLDDFRGRSIRVRFLAGFDIATGVRDGFAGWFIDDIRLTYTLYDCR